MYPWSILKTYLCLCYPYDIQDKTYDSEDNVYFSIWADDLSHWEDLNFAGSCSLKKGQLDEVNECKVLIFPSNSLWRWWEEMICPKDRSFSYSPSPAPPTFEKSKLS